MHVGTLKRCDSSPFHVFEHELVPRNGNIHVFKKANRLNICLRTMKQKTLCATLPTKAYKCPCVRSDHGLCTGLCRQKTPISTFSRSRQWNTLVGFSGFKLIHFLLTVREDVVGKMLFREHLYCQELAMSIPSSGRQIVTFARPAVRHGHQHIQLERSAQELKQTPQNLGRVLLVSREEHELSVHARVLFVCCDTSFLSSTSP